MAKALNIAGLKRLLTRFDENGNYAKSGDFSIGRGGYDLDWQLSYKGVPIVESVGNKLSVLNNDYDYSKVTKTIQGVYGSKVAAKGQSNG